MFQRGKGDVGRASFIENVILGFLGHWKGEGWARLIDHRTISFYYFTLMNGFLFYLALTIHRYTVREITSSNEHSWYLVHNGNSGTSLLNVIKFRNSYILNHKYRYMKPLVKNCNVFVLFLNL